MAFIFISSLFILYINAQADIVKFLEDFDEVLEMIYDKILSLKTYQFDLAHLELKPLENKLKKCLYNIYTSNSLLHHKPKHLLYHIHAKSMHDIAFQPYEHIKRTITCMDGIMCLLKQAFRRRLKHKVVIN